MRVKMALFLLIFLSGCTSVPHVDGAIKVKDETVEDVKYQIKIDREYRENPAEFQYAVNNFVKAMGHTSYDLIMEPRGNITDYYVIVPGSIPVEDLPPVKHFHKGRTVMAIVIPIVGAALVAAQVYMWYYIMSLWYGW